ncbi:methylase involved in ubiquinone/menaquinone biosynthesis [Burkholderiales bacterium JOSHI_001]|nr:methylase involved in ubiquinone/menaquinone biosynthesis [Burkholderiales bacterium JOSHI_001]
MLREHLHALQPVCPACRTAGRRPAPLVLGPVARSDGDEVLEGALLCSDRLCQREHPILDGIPVVVADIAAWAAHQLPGALRREDLSPFTESLLGDAAGPGSEWFASRSHVSIYGWAHWGDVPAELSARRSLAHGGAYVALLREALALCGAPQGGVWLDLGCSVGRGTLELARAGAGLALGLDLNFAMLRVAERVRREGRARFALRRGGVVFDTFDAAVDGVPHERMAYWCCDVSVLPLADAQAQGALMLNLLDCVPQPLALLFEAGRVLAPGAVAAFSSPYDWSPNATPLGEWLGGHSQRSASGGDSAAELRRVLSAERAAGVDTGLVLEADRDGVAWQVQTAERSTMAYQVHLARLRRRAA